MLEVVTGPFHSALEREFVGRLKAAKGDPLAPLVVIAPSRRLSARLKELALEAFPDGVANVHFHNLYSFARELYGGQKGWRLVEDDLFHEKLVERLITDHITDGALARALELRSGAKAILGAVKDLREGAVDATPAIELFKEGGLGGETLKELLTLHLLYDAALRDRKVHSRADVVRLAASNVGRIAGARVFYYGFYELVQAQIDLFRAVATWCDVTLFYPLAAGDPDFAFAQDFYDSIVRGATSRVTDCAEKARVVEPRVVSASGARDEVWACAKWILAMRERGVPFREIGVVARTLDPYVDHLESLFGAHAIPFSSSASVPVEREPLFVAAKLLLELAENDFRRDEVMDLIASPYFRRADGDDPALWDLATRFMGVGHGAREWERRLPPSSEDYAYSEGARGHDKKFVLPAAQVDRLSRVVRALLANAPAAEGTWAQRSNWARNLFTEFLEPHGLLDEVLDALASLDDVLEPPTAAEYRQTFRQRLSRTGRPAGRENVAGVRVLDAMASRGLPFRAVWVMGMNERVFPRYILEDAFLDDPVRARLNHRLGCRLPSKLKGYDEETLLFRLLRDSARETLVLSYQRSDDRGRLQVPSVFLENRRADDAVPRRPGERLKTQPFERLTPREAVLRAELRSGRGVEAAKGLGLPTGSLEPALDFLRLIETDAEAGVRDGLTGALPDHWDRARKNGISATALETYATCGFLYFAQKVVGLEELDEPEAEDATTAMETGNLYHEILQQVYQTVDFDEATGRAFDALEVKRSMRYPLLWESERGRLRKVLEKFLAYDRETMGSWVPAWFELKVEQELLGVTFMGYIDRIDVNGAALRVIDYKKSRMKYRGSVESAVFKNRTHYQPPLYLLLAAAKLRSMGRTVDLGASKAGYLFLEEEDHREAWLDDFESRQGEWLKILEQQVTGMSGGDFVLREGEHCRYCDFRSACRKNHLPTRLRAREWNRA